MIVAPVPDWLKYEGTFTFTYVCPKGIKFCLGSESKLLRKLADEIRLAYPHEQFELVEGGGSYTELFVGVKCNKSLADKFKLYKRDVEYDKWTPFDLRYYSFWAVKQKS